MHWLVKSSLLAAVAMFSLISSAAQQIRREQAAPAYQIQSGDVLLVSVWSDPQLSGQIFVNRDGRIILPVLGEIAARGLTTDGLVSAIRDRLLENVNNPQVVVTVLSMGNTRKPRQHRVPLAHPILNDSPPDPNAPRPVISGRA